MPDLDAAASERGGAQISTDNPELLMSRAVVARIASHADCCSNMAAFEADFQDAVRPDAPSSTRAAAIGRLNLLAEVSRRRRDANPCKTCTATAARTASSLQHLGRLLCIPDSLGAYRAAMGLPGDGISYGEWCLAIQDKTTLWEDLRKEHDPADSPVVQVLAMHVLDRVLAWYETLLVPRERAELNVVLVPLLRLLFSNPSGGHVAYQRYWFGEAEQQQSLFHRLYGGLIAGTERLKGRCVAERSELLVSLSGTGGDLAEELTKILHGSSRESLLELGQRTAICQMSLLVKDADDGESDEVRYSSQLVKHGVYYPPSRGAWPKPWCQAPPELPERFYAAISSAHEGKRGHAREHLRALFGSPERGLVWLHDGEITFYSLVRTKAIGPPTTIAQLFEGERATGKGWALLNFLERLAVHGRPASLARKDSGAGELARVLYQRLWSLDFVRSTATDALTAIRKTDDSDFRLRTLLPELILRSETNEPLSLFFYPIYGKVGAAAAGATPEVLIGGTVGGVGGGELPDVAQAYDYYLFAAMQAARPVIDSRISSVLTQRLDNVARAKSEALQNEVAPVVRDLARLFEDARGKLARIEAAVDSDWSGLFGDALAQGVAPAFEDGRRLNMSEVPGFENYDGRSNHVLKSSVDLYAMLAYVTFKVLLPSSEAGKWPALAQWEPSPGIPEGRVSGVEVAGLGDNTTYVALQDSYRWMAQAWSYMLTAQKSRIPTLEQSVSEHVHLVLKTLTVRSLETSRPIHPVQIVAALGLGGDEVCVAWLEDNCWESSYQRFDLKSKDHTEGIQPLADLMASLRHWSDKGLPVALPASRIARALRLLKENALGKGGVTFRQSVVLVRNGAIAIVLLCSGRFDADAKSSLSAHVTSGDLGGGHDLRTHFGVLCQAAQGHPMGRMLQFDFAPLGKDGRIDWNFDRLALLLATNVSGVEIVEELEGAVASRDSDQKLRTAIVIRFGKRVWSEC
ncbi:MAG: hypothetical protein U0Q55_04395 [Vicinamibacterales bacterium]